jgi:hypothetical protein
MNRISFYQSEKMRLKFLKELPGEVLKQLLFAFSQPQDDYVLDESFFKQFNPCTDKEKEGLFNSELFKRYDGKNSRLSQELKCMLSTIDDIIKRNNIVCVGALPTTPDREEALGMLCSRLNNNLPNLLEQKQYEVIGQLLNYSSDDVFRRLSNHGIYLGTQPYDSIIITALDYARGRYAGLNADIEQTMGIVDQFTTMDLEDCRIIKIQSTGRTI